MKCISCGKETERPNDLMCASCSSSFINSVDYSLANKASKAAPKAKRFTKNLNTEPLPQAKPLEKLQPQAKANPPSREELTNSAGLINSNIPTIEEAPMAGSISFTTEEAEPIKERGGLQVVLAVFSVVAVLVTTLVVAYLVVILPYHDTHDLVTQAQTTLSAAEKTYTETMFQVNKMVNYYQEEQEPRQIGMIRNEMDRLTKTSSSAYSFFDNDANSPFGSVAGDNTLTYDAEIEAQTQLVYVAKSYVELAYDKHDQLLDLQNLTVTNASGRELVALLGNVTDAGDKLLGEMDTVVGFEDYTLTLTKRLDDMAAALNQAYATDDYDLFVKTISEVRSELQTYETEFKKLKKPAGSDSLVENLTLTLASTRTFFQEYELAFKTNDVQRIINATNQYLIDSVKFANRAEDDIQSYSNSLTLGADFDKWRSAKNTAVSAMDAASETFLYKLVDKLPF